MLSHLLCDFDGTLVDSSSGILKAAAAAISENGYRAIVEPSRAAIGPPLRSMLTSLTGVYDQRALDAMVLSFKRHYDSDCYKETMAFGGVESAFAVIRARATRLHIVTNKRAVPTKLILAMLGWDRFFASVNTLDSSPNLTNKTELVAGLLTRLGAAERVAMIGDTRDDAEAASDNHIPFGWVRWGYGTRGDIRVAAAEIQSPPQIADFALGIDCAA